MLQNSFVFAAILLAASAAGNAISGFSVQKENDFQIEYNGNDLIVGDTAFDQVLLQSGQEVWKIAVRGQIRHETLVIYSHEDYEIVGIRTYDRAANEEDGASVQLIHGGPGHNIAVLLFTSKVGQPIRASVVTGYKQI